jgi:DedD protein
VDDRLKERLTGAVILVVIVVLLVPEMFRGRALGDATAALAPVVVPAQSQAPVRTYTLDSTPAAPAPAAEVVHSPAESEPAAMPALQPPAASAVPTATPAPTTAPVAAAAAGKGWVVQVGSFSVRENAERMVKQGAKVGMKLQVAGPDDKGFYRVRSAVLHDRAAALKLQARYKELGFKSLINSAP